MPKKKILIVDDEPHFITTLKDRLIVMGYEVDTAENGKEALEKAQGSPDLILLDILMPGLDGIEVAGKLKNSDKTSSIPIIMVTAKGQMEDVTKATDAGVDDYIVKPFSPQILLEKIRKVLK